MTTINLDAIFTPKSIALFGASDREGSVGRTLTQNLLKDPFEGSIWLVNPKHKSVSGQACYKDVKSCPGVPDLAIIATPPKYVPGIIRDLGKQGTKAAVVITAGLTEHKITQRMLLASQPYQLRIMGPNSMGIMLPKINLNASFAHGSPLPGDLAFLSQSGAVMSSVLDWATGKRIGFSCMMSVGNMSDVDLGDLIDYLSEDKNTRGILMYIEQIKDARKFMSAARAAARIKPIVAIKSGRYLQSAIAAHSHTGALSGSDAVYDAVLHRAGILRVFDLEELFVAVETLSHLKQSTGERLGIITNGGGIGVLAVDSLLDYGGRLATLSTKTIRDLDRLLPQEWSRANPIDILGDAPAERYQKTIEVALQDPKIETLLIMNCPTALASNVEAAQKTIETIEHYNRTQPEQKKTILTAWLGDETARKARHLFADYGYPTYESPDDAVRGLTYLQRHTRNIKSLMHVPPTIAQEFKTDPMAARELMQPFLNKKETMLNEYYAKKILEAYEIPTVNTKLARNPKEVYDIAKRFLDTVCTEVVVKVLAESLSHKSEVEGVVLHLETPQEAQQAAESILAYLKERSIKANIEGFSVQPMIHYPEAYEVIIGMHVDPVFGPVIMFGAGGTAVEIIKDTALGLPPLDLNLAQELILETRIYKLLKGYRHKPAVDLHDLALTLVKVSQMIIELPEITELDINPLLVDQKGVLALDARMVVKPSPVEKGKPNPFLTIQPYPKQWERELKLADGETLFIRPIRPQDESYYPTFMSKTSLEDIRLRLFTPMRQLSKAFVARLTQIDYAREIAFLALDPVYDEMLSVARLTSNLSRNRAEYAIITRTDVKGRGIGRAMMKHLIRYAQAEGYGEIWGQVLSENHNMLKLCKELGFTEKTDPQDATITVVTLKITKG